MKGTADAPSSEEAVKASTWYILFKELLVFSSAKPENFITGLVLLSELLPTPLPVHTIHNLMETEVRLVKMRKNLLWKMNNSKIKRQKHITTNHIIIHNPDRYYLKIA